MGEEMQAEKSTKCVVLFQALGDNLISLSLLSQHAVGEKIVILGTAHTKKIAELMGVADRFEIEVVFDDIPAFYDLRKKGLVQALKDLLFFRRFLRQRRSETIVFEKKDFRSMLLTFGLSRALCGGNIRQTYLDRKALFEESSTDLIRLKASIQPDKKPRSVLIAPSSRLRVKNIRHRDLDILLAALHGGNIAVSLVDYTEEYTAFAGKVETYRTGTTLDEVKTMMLEHDLLIGADSFLIHLAYYFEKPFLAVYNAPNLDFLPPGAELIDNYIIVDPVRDNRGIIGKKLKALGITA